MPELSLDDLNAFILRAKAATYVGSGAHRESCRPGSHDLVFRDGPFSYLDSYFGGADFVGQEVVWFEDRPVWAMNYYGRILRPDLIQPAQGGRVIRESLSAMYRTGHFLGGWHYQVDGCGYTDASTGGVASFTGTEWITVDAVCAYELIYHGGLVKA